jgi:putative flippase GtrA
VTPRKAVEQPIRKSREKREQSSHLRTARESVRIHWQLARFSVVAVLSALLDNLAFWGFFRATSNLLGSQVGARVISLLFNYPAVQRRVFDSDERHCRALPKYLLLVAVNLTLSYLGVRLLASRSVPVIWAKLSVDGLLFLLSFLVQRGFVFIRRRSFQAVS